MTQKTKFEKKDTNKTKVTFSPEEVHGFVHGAYAAARHAMYLQRVHERPQNPRLDSRGHEILSDVSTVADVDMHPLSMRNNISRFHTPLVNGDGFDFDDPKTDDEVDYHMPDRIDNFPTPHEERSRDLSKRLTKIRAEHEENLKVKRKDGETTTHKDTPPETENKPSETPQK